MLRFSHTIQVSQKDRRFARHLAAFACVATLWMPGAIQAQTSTLVYEDGNGVLKYGTYANQGQANAVNTVPDFSNCGYKGGGELIPFVPTVVTVSAPTGGDDTTLIQNAIDTVSAMSVQANGFRGAVLIKAGDYLVSSTLTINASGIVIRGEGQQATGGTKITMTATVQDNLFEVAGSGSPSTVGGSTQTITDSFVPVGAKSFNVANALGYTVGDTIRVKNTMNDQWIIDIGMNNISGGNPAVTDWTAAGYQLYHERTIASISGTTLTLEAPLVQAVEDQYGGGEVFKYTFSGQLENIGFESLRLESTYLAVNDEQHGWIGIKFSDSRNIWVRQVTGRHFGYGLVSVNGTSHYATIEDCAMLDPKSITTGGRKYSFNIDDATYVLMQRCYTRGGRHDFVSGSQTPGPNAFVECLAEQTNSDVGPHHRYATGQLYDNVKCGALNVQNRKDSGSGHGWSGAQVMFWNCDTSSIISESPTGAMNWAIGCKGTLGNGNWVNEPDGIRESHGTHVTPRSLYYRQLQERLSRSALRNVILPDQEAGTIWSGLSSWAGEGLYSDDVIAWSSSDLINPPTDSVNLTGRVRNLQMLENGVTTTWSKFSGPGTVTFGNSSQLSTTANFGTEGTYVIRLTANDGVTTKTFDVTVRYGNNAPTVDAGTNQSVVSSGSSEWTPTEITTAAWYDAADAASITESGGMVSQWNDKSGNANHASQATELQKPTLMPAAIGGLNTISFNRTNDQKLTAAHNNSLNLDASGGANIFAIFNYTGYLDQTSGLNVMLTKGSMLGSGAGYGIRINSNDSLGYKAGADLNPSAGTPTNQDVIFSGVRDDGAKSASTFINGSSINTATVASISSDNNEVLVIGGDTNSTRYADVDFGEIILVPGVLDADQRQRLEGYLAHKWGLETSLPNGHPYETTSPTADIATASLDGTIYDSDGDSMTVSWSKVSGPGVVTFTDATAVDTTVGFSANGIYILRLTVDDGYTTSSDDIQITVHTHFDAWVETNGTGSETFSGDSNDDGVADGMAWLLGAASPASYARSLLPSSAENSGALTLNFNVLKSSKRGAAVLQLQFSNDLGLSDLWDDHTVTVPETSSTVSGVVFVITPNGDVNEVQATIPESAAGGSGKVFVRLSGAMP